jgi:hypothetical protein
MSRETEFTFAELSKELWMLLERAKPVEPFRLSNQQLEAIKELLIDFRNEQFLVAGDGEMLSIENVLESISRIVSGEVQVGQIL